MHSSKVILLAVLAACVLLAEVAVIQARPSHRLKRVSDQRLGELEALLALKKLRGKMVTVPVAYGQINPDDIGRRRRSLNDQSVAERLLSHLLAEEVVPQYDDEDVADTNETHWTQPQITSHGTAD